MQKSFRTTLILVGVFGLLIAWFLIYEKRKRPEQTEAEEKSKSVVSIEAKEIIELEIERMKNAPPDSAENAAFPEHPEYEKIKLKKSGDDWHLMEPVQDAADTGAVSANVSTLATTKQERVVDEKPTDYAQFGLKNPLLKITARSAGGTKSTTVLVGRNTPTGFSSYLQVDGKPTVYRVTRTLRTAFDKDAKSIRNKNILNVPKAEIGEVEIQLKKENIVLKKDEKIKDREEWLLARDNIPADTTEWQKTLNAVAELRATDFAAEDAKSLAQFGLVAPVARMWLIRTKDKSKVGFALGSVKDKVYLKREDRSTVYEVDKEILKKVERPSREYRSLRLANFNRFDVKRVKLERSGTDTLELLKDDKGWSLPTNPSVKIDSAKVDTFLTNIQDGKITNYLSADSKETAPKLTIRLYEKKENKETERIFVRFGKEQGKQILADRSDLDLPFLLPLDDFKKLNLLQKDFEVVEKKEDKKDEKKTEEKAPPAKQG